MLEGDAVAVIGMGAIFPGAADTRSFWRNIVEGSDAVSDVPALRWDPAVYHDAEARGRPVSTDRFYCRRGGFVDDVATFDPARFGIMPVVVEGTEPDQLLALTATAEAIGDAGGEDRLGDRGRIGVVLGRGGYMGPATARLDSQVRTAAQLVSSLGQLVPDLTRDQLEEVRRDFQARLGDTQPEAAVGLIPNVAASRIANRFDFAGPAYTVDAACASGLVAVELSMRELQSRRCDVMVAGAVHHCHLATLWSVFTQMRALSPSQCIRPFDRRADGTLIAEGTGVILLKRLADAERDGNPVYAVLRGVASSSDGRSSSLVHPSPAGQILAVERAWQDAGLDPRHPEAIGLLEAHGTGTPVGDEAELTTIAKVFGPAPASGPRPGMGTVKSMIAHAMPASGIAGLIKAVLAVHHGLLPPTLHAEEPHPLVTGTRFRLVDRTEPWDRGPAPRRAGVNAFGFGGVNAHVIVEEPPGTRRAAAVPARPTNGPDDEPILTLAAPTVAELGRLLEGRVEDLLATARAGVKAVGGPCRLAVVDPEPRRLDLARRVVGRGVPWRGRNSVWFTATPLATQAGRPSAPRLAYLFPGFEPAFEPRVQDVAHHLDLPVPELTGSTDLVGHALDVIGVGRLLAGALGRLGVRADVMAGHSLGEWTAMLEAGMYPPETIDTVVSSLRGSNGAGPEMSYGALGCGAGQAADLASVEPGVVVSHDNCPHQSVVCGPTPAVVAVVGRARAAGVLAQELPLHSGFHTPMMAPLVSKTRQIFARVEVFPPQVPVWSATSLGPFPTEPTGVRELVVRHLLEPVRFLGLVKALYEAGVRIFVQVGPGSISGFVSDTLGSADHLSVAGADPRRSGLGQLRQLAAALWTEGVACHLERLGRAQPSAATSGTEVKLRLGTPLVTLGAATVEMASAGRRAPGAGRGTLGGLHPVLDAFDTALQEVSDSAGAVLGAWKSPLGPGRLRPPGTSAAVPGTRRWTRRFSLGTMPELIDHCIVPQPPGWSDPTDRFPVVPMTTMLEVLAEAARAMAPGWVVTAIESIRALRWLVVAPPTDAVVTARLEPAGEARPGGGPAGEVRARAHVAIEGYAEGTVLLGPSFGPAPPASQVPLSNPRPAHVSARALYDDGWMFHGPGYASVEGIAQVADDGISGTLVSLPASGALLDGATQLAGHWVQVTAPHDKLVFPTGMDQVSLFGPPPPPGAVLSCTARVHSLTPNRLRADLELVGADGALWAVVKGYTCRRFPTDDLLWSNKFRPDAVAIGEEQPGGWCLVREHWGDTASRELVMRRYLGAAERADYARRRPRAQRQWLLGRMAAKDAVRHWLWHNGGGALFPVEVDTGNHADGRPWVRARPAPDLEVSLAHAGELGAAIVSRAGDETVGIDVEVLADRGTGVERVALGADEMRLLDGLSAGTVGGGQDSAVRAEWTARLWVAKEAVAKAEGTGLAGRPKAIAVLAVDPAPGYSSDLDEEATEANSGDGGLSGDICLVVASPGGRRYRVRTRLISGHGGPSYVVGWTRSRRREVG